MLTVKIFSFIYLYTGLPEDTSGNGGGFVFDCRFIYNPGKVQRFQNMTGNDEPVKKTLDSKPEMQTFLSDVKNIISAAIKNYVGRDFTSLMVSFGCTGGQHRSVYSAERMKEYIETEFPEVNVELKHLEL